MLLLLNFRERYMVISFRVLHDPRGKVLHLEHVQTMCSEGSQPVSSTCLQPPEAHVKDWIRRTNAPPVQLLALRVAG